MKIRSFLLVFSFLSLLFEVSCFASDQNELVYKDTEIKNNGIHLLPTRFDQPFKQEISVSSNLLEEKMELGISALVVKNNQFEKDLRDLGCVQFINIKKITQGTLDTVKKMYNPERGDFILKPGLQIVYLND